MLISNSAHTYIHAGTQARTHTVKRPGQVSRVSVSLLACPNCLAVPFRQGLSSVFCSHDHPATHSGLQYMFCLPILYCGLLRIIEWAV